MPHLVERLFDRVGLRDIVRRAGKNVGNEIVLVMFGDDAGIERSQIMSSCLWVHSKLVFDLGKEDVLVTIGLALQLGIHDLQAFLVLSKPV